MGENGSKEMDGSSGQSDRRRKRSRNFIAALAQTEGVIVQGPSSNTAAMELTHTHTHINKTHKILSQISCDGRTDQFAS